MQAAYDTASALEYLHCHCIAHGDVYAHNMLASESGKVTLCDYGASFFYEPGQRAVWEAMEVRPANSTCLVFNQLLCVCGHSLNLSTNRRSITPQHNLHSMCCATHMAHTSCMHRGVRWCCCRLMLAGKHPCAATKQQYSDHCYCHAGPCLGALPQRCV